MRAVMLSCVSMGDRPQPMSSCRHRTGGVVSPSEKENEDRAASEVFLVAEVRLVALCGAALVEVQLVWCGA